ncbi:MAG: ABC transporter permease, partial [Succinivibrionaceae bacterium]|nr:ABC transporter permease [Succinivibrionaceae bacterium]
MRLMDSICDEVAAWRSGHFPPYQKMAIMIALATCVIFSIIFQHGEVFEGRIAVIDLDHSAYSTHLIERVDASAYVDVDRVYHYPVDPRTLTAHDANIGILYIPKDLERHLLNSHHAISLGYFADYTNPQQNANIIEAINGILGELGGQIAGTAVGAGMGLPQHAAKAVVRPMSLAVRHLYNPTMAATPETTMPFVHFFSSLILGLTTLMVIGRLKVTGQWDRVLDWGPLALMARLVPYALCYTTAISLVTAVLVNFGQMPFEGSFACYALTIFMTALCIGLLAFHFSFHTKDPSGGPQFMILFVPPGFIMGGATMAVGILPAWMYL